MFKDKIKLKKWKKWNEENRKFSRNVFIAGCMFFIISYIGMGFFIEGIEDLFIFLLVALFGLCFMIISVIVKSSSDNLLQRVEIYYKTKDYLLESLNKKK